MMKRIVYKREKVPTYIVDVIDSWIKSNNRGIRRRGNVRNGNGRYRGWSNCYDRSYHKPIQ